MVSPSPSLSGFSERDGITVSTCDVCFTTFASSPLNTELEKAEHEHICSPETLEHWKMLMADIKRRDAGESESNRSGVH